MAIHGDLSTMPLTDLLQWAGTCSRTGTLKVERDRVIRRIHIKNGRVIGCSSDDPPNRLGQFLLSRGRINEAQLQQALARQEGSGGNLGNILVEMGVINTKDLLRHVADKGQETIYGLFDWEDAVFHFVDHLEPDPYMIDVDLEVQEVLLKGLERFDEMKMFRETFHDRGMVLAHTDVAPPEKILATRMPRRIYDSINGERTIAEVLLHAHASEYLVIKFLHQLHKKGMVEIKEIRTVQAQQAVAELQQQVQAAMAVGRIAMGAGSAGGASAEGSPAEGGSPDIAPEIQVAVRLMDRGEFEASLELLNAAYRACPSDLTVRQLIIRAEHELEQAHQHDLGPNKVPILQCPVEDLIEHGLSPEASFLPSLIDGRNDIKSILWVAPMRTVDVLRALKQMVDKDLIALCDPV